MQRTKKKKGLVYTRNLSGYTFVLPWIIGLLLFFFFPIAESIIYAFSEVNIGSEGLTTEFVGLENVRYMFQEDAHYTNNLRDSVISMLTSLPIIMSLSLILAVVLNQDFKGRLVARAIFFLPVIIANAVTMNVMRSEYIQVPLFAVSSGAQYNYGGLIDFNMMLSQLNMPNSITNLFSSYLGNVFNLIWSCGVQTILFLAGLQSITKHLYEVSKIEGASRWEEFWFIEVPMLRHVILLVLIYTMIELFVAMDNPAMKQIYSSMYNSQIYDTSSAMLWGYFLIIGVTMSLIVVAYNRFCMERWE